jgi:hypothetical protein
MLVGKRADNIKAATMRHQLFIEAYLLHSLISEQPLAVTICPTKFDIAHGP